MIIKNALLKNGICDILVENGKIAGVGSVQRDLKPAKLLPHNPDLFRKNREFLHALASFGHSI